MGNWWSHLFLNHINSSNINCSGRCNRCLNMGNKLICIPYTIDIYKKWWWSLLNDNNSSHSFNMSNKNINNTRSDHFSIHPQCLCSPQDHTVESVDSLLHPSFLKPKIIWCLQCCQTLSIPCFQGNWWVKRLGNITVMVSLYILHGRISLIIL